MKRSRFSEGQINATRREQESVASTADVCRHHEINSATFYDWKIKFGGLEVLDAKKLLALEDWNARLTRHLADAMSEYTALRDVAGKK